MVAQFYRGVQETAPVTDQEMVRIMAEHSVVISLTVSVCPSVSLPACLPVSVCLLVCLSLHLVFYLPGDLIISELFMLNSVIDSLYYDI